MKPLQLLILALGTVFGLLTIYIMLSSNNAKQPEVPVIQATAQKKYEYLVAKKNISEKSLLTRDDVMWQTFEKNPDRQNNYYSLSDNPNALANIEGLLTTRSILAGDLIDKTQLRIVNGGYLAAVLPKGYRAITLTVDASSLKMMAPYMSQGDHIDLVASETGPKFPDSSNRSIGRLDSRTVLSDVLVLILDKKTSSETSLIVALTPQQVERVRAVMRTSKLSVSLRPADENRSSADQNYEQLLVIQGNDVSEVMVNFDR